MGYLSDMMAARKRAKMPTTFGQDMSGNLPSTTRLRAMQAASGTPVRQMIPLEQQGFARHQGFDAYGYGGAPQAPQSTVLRDQYGLARPLGDGNITPYPSNPNVIGGQTMIGSLPQQSKVMDINGKRVVMGPGAFDRYRTALISGGDGVAGNPLEALRVAQAGSTAADYNKANTQLQSYLKKNYENQVAERQQKIDAANGVKPSGVLSPTAVTAPQQNGLPLDRAAGVVQKSDPNPWSTLDLRSPSLSEASGRDIMRALGSPRFDKYSRGLQDQLRSEAEAQLELLKDSNPNDPSIPELEAYLSGNLQQSYALRKQREATEQRDLFLRSGGLYGAYFDEDQYGSAMRDRFLRSGGLYGSLGK